MVEENVNMINVNISNVSTMNAMSNVGNMSNQTITGSIKNNGETIVNTSINGIATKDILPNPTVYINNLNDKIKLDGK